MATIKAGNLGGPYVLRWRGPGNAGWFYLSAMEIMDGVPIFAGSRLLSDGLRWPKDRAATLAEVMRENDLADAGPVLVTDCPPEA